MRDMKVAIIAKKKLHYPLTEISGHHYRGQTTTSRDGTIASTKEPNNFACFLYGNHSKPGIN